jgi:hypothetical protein
VQGGCAYVACTTPLGTGRWAGLAISENGQYVVIADSGSSNMGYLYTSSNFGSNWNLQNRIGAGQWGTVACDSTGKYIIAAQIRDYIYTSKDFGSNWSSNTILGKGFWSGVTSDSSGKYLVASKSASPANGMYTWGESNSSGYMYRSTNYGSNWSQIATPTSEGQWGGMFQAQWYGLTSDSTGRYVAVARASLNNYVITSSDYGNSWTVNGQISWTPYLTSRFSTNRISTAYGNLPSNIYVASSSNGQFIVAGNPNGSTIYISKDYGSNWSSNNCLNPCISAGQTGSDYSSTGMRQNYTWADSNGTCVKNNNGAAVCDSSYAAATVQGGCAYVAPYVCNRTDTPPADTCNNYKKRSVSWRNPKATATNAADCTAVTYGTATCDPSCNPPQQSTDPNACGYFTPCTPVGTQVGTPYCVEYTLLKKVANGLCGTYNEAIQYNSPDCGYVVKTAPNPVTNASFTITGGTFRDWGYMQVYENATFTISYTLPTYFGSVNGVADTNWSGGVMLDRSPDGMNNTYWSIGGPVTQFTGNAARGSYTATITISSHGMNSTPVTVSASRW